MPRVKTFLKYVLMLIGLYIIVNLLTYWLTMDTYKNITDYKILTEEPTISITECKATYSKGHINGTITNNTSEQMREIYIKIDLYDKEENYLGTKYEAINILNVSETNKFSIAFDYSNVNSVQISTTNEKPKSDIYVSDKVSETVEKWFPFIGIITLIYLLP